MPADDGDRWDEGEGILVIGSSAGDMRRGIEAQRGQELVEEALVRHGPAAMSVAGRLERSGLPVDVVRTTCPDRLPAVGSDLRLVRRWDRVRAELRRRHSPAFGELLRLTIAGRRYSPGLLVGVLFLTRDRCDAHAVGFRRVRGKVLWRAARTSDAMLAVLDDVARVSPWLTTADRITIARHPLAGRITWSVQLQCRSPVRLIEVVKATAAERGIGEALRRIAPPRAYRSGGG